MSKKYRFDRRTTKHKKRHTLIVSLICVVVVVAIVIAGTAYIHRSTKKNVSVNGPTLIVGSISNNSLKSTKLISEPTYQFRLPNTWKQTKSDTSPLLNNVTWQSFAPNATNRYLIIYTNPLPTTLAVNRELPIEAHGSVVSFGSLSDNCANFTNTGPTKTIVPVLAKWQEVSFYCDSANPVDNKVGTGTVGAINSVTLNGESSGPHNYFFEYIDRNSSPDYSIFYNVLNSFQAK